MAEQIIRMGPDTARQTNRRLLATVGRGLTLCLLAFCSSFVSAGTEAERRWFLLEFADARPPCMDVAEGTRCIGTRPRTTVFEMLDGERLDMPTSTPLPPAWAAFDDMWVYGPAIGAHYGRRSIELAETPMGARLIINEGDRHYLQSVPLSRWVALESKNQPKLWVRVTPHSP